MKEIKVKLISIDELKFEIVEKAEKGDFFYLRELSKNEDFFDIELLKKEFITSGGNIISEEERKKEIERIKKEIETQKDIQILEIKNGLEKEKQQLEFENKELKNNKDLSIQNIKSELEKEKQKLEFENNKLKIQNETIIKNIENEKLAEIEKEKSKIQKQFYDELTSLQEEKINLENSLKQKEEELKNKIDLLNKDNELKIEKETSKIQNQFFNQISSLQEEKLKLVNNLEKKDEELKNKIDLLNKDNELKIEKETSELKRKIGEIERKEGNIKQIGEDLEDWIETKFHEYFGFNDNISIEQPVNINGTKPDFIIRIYDNDKNEIETIVIEAKSESLKSVVKKKNKDHYEKLIKDTVNNHGGYSILVSELEKGNEFTIFKAEPNKYNNLYVVRPYFFMHLIQVILEITLKDQELKKKEIFFKDKNEILKQWEDFKLNLGSSFEKIEKQIESIQKEKEKIIDAANKIENSINVIFHSHISALVNKINKFNIDKRITSKIDLIEENSEIKLIE